MRTNSQSDLIKLSEYIQELEDKIISGDIESLWFDNPNLQSCCDVNCCSKKECPGYGRKKVRCWQLVGTFCKTKDKQDDFGEKWEDCRNCDVFKKATPTFELRYKEFVNNLIFAISCFDPERMNIVKIKKIFPSVSNEFNLTIKERSTLLLMLDNMTRNQIAEVLSVTLETTKMHIKNIYKKMSIKSRGELINLMNLRADNKSTEDQS